MSSSVKSRYYSRYYKVAPTTEGIVGTYYSTGTTRDGFKFLLDLIYKTGITYFPQGDYLFVNH